MWLSSYCVGPSAPLGLKDLKLSDSAIRWNGKAGILRPAVATHFGRPLVGEGAGW